MPVTEFGEQKQFGGKCHGGHVKKLKCLKHIVVPY